MGFFLVIKLEIYLDQLILQAGQVLSAETVSHPELSRSSVVWLFRLTQAGSH